MLHILHSANIIDRIVSLCRMQVSVRRRVFDDCQFGILEISEYSTFKSRIQLNNSIYWCSNELEKTSILFTQFSPEIDSFDRSSASDLRKNRLSQRFSIQNRSKNHKGKLLHAVSSTFTHVSYNTASSRRAMIIIHSLCCSFTNSPLYTTGRDPIFLTKRPRSPSRFCSNCQFRRQKEEGQTLLLPQTGL